MRSVAKRRLGSVVVDGVTTTVNVKWSVLIGETVVHLVVLMDLMMMDVLMIGCGRYRVAVLTGHRFAIPHRPVVFYWIKYFISINISRSSTEMFQPLI